MTATTRKPALIAIAALLLSLFAVAAAKAQPAPIPRAVVPASAAPEAMGDMFAGLESGDRTIRFAGAQWLQLQFSDFQLGAEGQLKITAVNGDSQTFNQEQLEAWEGLTAIFNGSEVTVTLTPGPSGEISAEIEEVIVGLPGAGAEGFFDEAPESLLEMLGDEPSDFLPPPPPREPAAGPEAICGSLDDRTTSTDPAVGRIMPIGCTGWIIDGGALLTAGHCISTTGTRTVEFNVPASLANGATVSPPVRDQYRVVAGSIVSANTGIGNDWAIFQVLPNTQTGLTPLAAQGSSFTLSDSANPNTVRITGFGVDGPSPGFGNPPPRNGDNQTQQTHNGTLTQNSAGGANTGVLRYQVDTQGGNSGSPVIVDGGNTAIGIHTNGGCQVPNGTNSGTSFRNQALWAAVQPPTFTVTLVNTKPQERLGKGETTEVIATVSQSGAPLPGVMVNFSSADTSLATVAPATATTNTSGEATATVTSQTDSSGSVEIRAESGGETGRVIVQVPDLSAAGFALLLLALLLLAMGRLGRREA